MIRTHIAGTGRQTERIVVELTPAEAEAFTEAWEHLEHALGDVDWPIATGLRRISREFRLDSEPVSGGKTGS